MKRRSNESPNERVNLRRPSSLLLACCCLLIMLAVSVYTPSALATSHNPVRPGETSGNPASTLRVREIDGDLFAQDRAVRLSSEKPGSVTSEVGIGDLYAVVVGVSQYRNQNIPKLKFSDKDAKDFAEFLKSQKNLFRRIHLTLLVNQQATQQEVKKHLFYELRKAGKNDTVVLFLSGHGADDPNMPGEFFFLTHDADPAFLEATAVNMGRSWFMQRLDSKRVVVIADTCHAGGFSTQGTRTIDSSLNRLMTQFKETEGRVFLSSCRPDQTSREAPDFGNGVFTHYFLEGLKGKADKDHDGVVTIREAYDYVYGRVKDHTQGQQHPQFEGRVVGLFPISFLAPSVTRLEIATDPSEADVYVVEKSTFTLAGRSDAKGSLLLENLPVDAPIILKVAKLGWRDKILDPVIFQPTNVSIKLPKVTLVRSLAYMVLMTDASNAMVSIDGKPAGRTGKDNVLIVNEIQTGITHEILIAKAGFEETKVSVTVPDSYEGKVYKTETIHLNKKASQTAMAQPATPLEPQKADEDAKPKKREEPAGKKREMELIQAVNAGDAELAKKLIAEKTDVNGTDVRGWTPLMHACSGNHPKLVRILLESGAAVNYADNLGWTPLMVAAGKGYREIVQILLAGKADVTIRNLYGQTALDIANTGRHEAVVKVLSGGVPQDRISTEDKARGTSHPRESTAGRAPAPPSPDSQVITGAQDKKSAPTKKKWDEDDLYAPYRRKMGGRHPRDAGQVLIDAIDAAVDKMFERQE